MFSKSSNYSIGLDISDLALKLVQLRKKGNKIKIQAIGRTSVPEGAIVNGEIINDEEVVKAIRNLIENPKYGSVSSDKVVACLPESKTFVKLIRVEKSVNQISDIIESEITKYIPFSLEDIYYDWQVMEDGGSFQNILIGGAPRKIVDQYTRILDKAQLSVEALEIEPITLCRSLLREESSRFKGVRDKSYAIIDIGAIRTSMIFYSKNSILFTISMPISGERITHKIAETLKINKKQAEKAKIICGLDQNKAEGVIYDILSDTVKDLNKELNHAINFYKDHFGDRGPLDMIIICGGGSNIKNVEKIIRDVVDVDVFKGDSLVNLSEVKENFSKLLTETHNLDISSSKSSKNLLSYFKSKSKNKGAVLSITQDSSSTFATAVGLALRGVFLSEL